MCNQICNGENNMSYKHLTIENRNVIESLSKNGYSARQIAEILSVHHSTVSRELKRCKGEYTATEAQKHVDSQNSNKGRKSLITPAIAAIIEEKLKLTWSPEQIIGRGIQELPISSFKTIYNWLYAGLLSVSKDVLRRKGKDPKTSETRGKFTIGPTIHERADTINNREEFGHWELDTVVSARGQSKSCLATFSERKSRFNIVVKMADRKKETMLQAIQNIIYTYGSNIFKSFTSDRGKEFACYPVILEQGIEFYFADAYAAWQRGTNENANGLIREFFPKKTNFDKVSDLEVSEAIHLINNRPRKSLNFRTALEVFIEEIQLLSKVSQ